MFYEKTHVIVHFHVFFKLKNKIIFLNYIYIYMDLWFFTIISFFNTIITNDGNDKHIFNTFCTNCIYVSLELTLNLIKIQFNSIQFNINSIPYF
jgi:hypothetical protein